MPSPKQPPRSANASPIRHAGTPPLAPPSAPASSLRRVGDFATDGRGGSSSSTIGISKRPMTGQTTTADIEMDAMRASSSHRRRRSSLLNGAAMGRRDSSSHSSTGNSNGNGSGDSSNAGALAGRRPRGQSLLLRRQDPSASSGVHRISEDGEAYGMRDDERGSGGGGGGWDAAWGSDDGNGDLHDDEETGLTEHERRWKAQARTRNMQFGQRIVPGRHERTDGDSDGDGNGDFDYDGSGRNGEDGAYYKDITADERKEADKAVLRRLLLNGTLIGLWYLFSLSLSLYNKWMFGGNKLNFAFPLFTTCIHMLVQFGLASLVLYFVPSLRPGADGKSGKGGDAGNNADDVDAGASTATADDSVDGSEDDAHKDTHGPQQSQREPGSARTRMTKMFYLTRIGPCGAATGLDIGLGNTSLKFITLTFYTMCKSSSLAFVLLFAFFFQLETPTWRLVAIIATMTLGVIMMVAGEVQFKLGGFLLVISAAFFSGFRWGLTQILLLRNPATSNPFSSIFYLAPVMFLTLLVLAVPAEGVGALLAGLRVLVAEWGPLRTPILIVFPGTIAFLMTASEFALLQRTSVVTLSIAGIFKEVVTIATAALVFGETLTAINALGLLITLAAITAYNYLKITKMRRQAQIDVHREHHHHQNHDLLPSAVSPAAAYAAGSPSASSSSPSGSATYPNATKPSFAASRSVSPLPAQPPGQRGNDAELEADTEDASLLRKPTSGPSSAADARSR